MMLKAKSQPFSEAHPESVLLRSLSGTPIASRGPFPGSSSKQLSNAVLGGNQLASTRFWFPCLEAADYE